MIRLSDILAINTYSKLVIKTIEGRVYKYSITQGKNSVKQILKELNL